MVTSGRAPVGALELAYETFGSPGDPAVVLVMGLGTQMLGWPHEFCRSLAGAGFFVVRFDNRDVGGSTHLRDTDVPALWRVLLHLTPPPYRLEEMAGDLLGLLDHLGLDKMHLVGASMGGFIAQLAAIAAPHRFASLTLMMTSTGSRRVGHPHPRAGRQLLRRWPAAPRPSRRRCRPSRSSAPPGSRPNRGAGGEWAGGCLEHGRQAVEVGPEPVGHSNAGN